MLTRHEVLAQLKRIGVKELSVFRRFLKDYEKYMQINNATEIPEKQMDDPLKNNHFEKRPDTHGAKSLY